MRSRLSSPRHGSGRPAGPAWQLGLAILFGLILTIGPGTAASAHATLWSTDPADGSRLGHAPATVIFTFSEPVTVIPHGVRLFTADGQPIVLETRSQGSTVTSRLPPLASDARYIVAWRVISADGHPASGALTFTVGHPAVPATLPGPASTEIGEVPGVDALYYVANAAGYLGLLTMAGLVAFDVLVLRGRRPDPGPRRLVRAAATTGAAGMALVIPLGVLRLMGTSAFTSGAGAWWQVLGWRPVAAAMLALAGPLTIWSRVWSRRGPSATSAARSAAGLGGVGVALLSPLLTGHTALRHPAWLIAGADAVHLSAGAVWLGGVVGLLIYLRPGARRARTPEPATAARVVSRFSTLAAGVVAALGLSGVVMAVMVVESWSALVGTANGRALLLKVGLVGLVLALAAWNRYRLLPAVVADPDGQHAWQSLRGTLLREAALIVTVLGVTGVLVNLSPTPASHPGPDGVPAPPQNATLAAIPITASSEKFDLVGEARLGPGGEWRLTITLRDSAGEPVRPAEPPDVESSLPSQDLGPLVATAEPTGAPGGWTAPLQLPFTGQWRISVGVRVSDLDYHRFLITVAVP